MLSEDAFLLLWENYKSTNPGFPWDSYDPFTLVNMDEAECKALQNFVLKKMISTGFPKPCKFQEH